MSDCEWNPRENRPAFMDDDGHGEATVSAGGDGKWFLCETCAALPQFKRFGKRPLGRRVPERVQRKSNRQLKQAGER